MSQSRDCLPWPTPTRRQAGPGVTPTRDLQALVGHGFTAENRAAGTAYYSFTKGDICFVVMDTVNPNGYADGSLDQTQFEWVKQTVAFHQDKAVVLFSHHTSETMSNPLIVSGGDPSPRVLGGTLVDFLLTQENVIAWINGHTHHNQIWARPNAAGTDGFWEINTASHIDFPQQSRLIEIVDNRNGSMSIFTTMVDHAGPVSRGGDLSTPAHLASLSRELSANDPQELTSGREGAAQDRNTELLVPTPAALRRAGCADPTENPTQNPTPDAQPTSPPGSGQDGTASPPPVPAGAVGAVGAQGAGPSGAGGLLPDTGLPDGLVRVGAAGLTAVMAGETLIRHSRKGGSGTDEDSQGTTTRR